MQPMRYFGQTRIVDDYLISPGSVFDVAYEAGYACVWDKWGFSTVIEYESDERFFDDWAHVES